MFSHVVQLALFDGIIPELSPRGGARDTRGDRERVKPEETERERQGERDALRESNRERERDRVRLKERDIERERCT